MRNILIGMSVVALMACTGKVFADDDPSVPKVCYAVISAQQECNENYIDWASTHAPAMLPSLEQLRSKWQGMRDKLPDAVKRYGADSMQKACAGPMTQGALTNQGQNAATIKAAGGDASRCVRALKALQ